MTPEIAKMLARIEAIDKMFEEATSWGSWMATASKERSGLVHTLWVRHSISVPHKYELQVV